MRQTQIVVEKTLDAVGLFVNWAAAWAAAIGILCGLILVFALQLDVAGAKFVSGLLIFSLVPVLFAVAIIALADLTLRVRQNDNIFTVLRRSWIHAPSFVPLNKYRSRIEKIILPFEIACEKFAATVRALLVSLWSLGRWVLGALILVVVGLVVYWAYGLFATAPWWAIVIIFLLASRR